ncbi:MAG TPA: phage/plasmid replication protein [Ignavibacteria bacterium]|nr:phage/plasmid replication protein [Ignavibacteria bacterium]
MYDTIKMYKLSLESINERYLTELRDEYNYSTGELVRKGKLDNLFINKHKWGVQIKGSICKYYYGNNLQTLTKNDTKFAFEKLNDHLHFNTGNSKITRLDFAENFIMEKPIVNYLNLFSELQRFQMMRFSNNVYYNTSDKKIAVYDKIKEVKGKKGDIPSKIFLPSDNVLRYEIRLLRRIKKVFGKEIFQKDLTNEVVFNNLLNLWKDLYFKISKKPIIKIDDMTFSNTKQFFNYLIYLTCEEKGEENILKLINTNKENFTNKVAYSRCKSAVRQKLKNKNFCKDNELINELNEKVLETVLKYK